MGEVKKQAGEQKRMEQLVKNEQKEKEDEKRQGITECVKHEKRRKKDEIHQHDRGKWKNLHISGSGRPHSIYDQNLNPRIGKDGLLEVERPYGWVGSYSPTSRKVRINRFKEKRKHRIKTKK